MEQTHQKEQKWDFFLFILNGTFLGAMIRLIIKKILQTEELPFGYYFVDIILSLGLAYGLAHILRRYPWRVKVWVTCILFLSELLLHALPNFV